MPKQKLVFRPKKQDEAPSATSGSIHSRPTRPPLSSKRRKKPKKAYAPKKTIQPEKVEKEEESHSEVVVSDEVRAKDIADFKSALKEKRRSKRERLEMKRKQRDEMRKLRIKERQLRRDQRRQAAQEASRLRKLELMDKVKREAREAMTKEDSLWFDKFLRVRSENVVSRRERKNRSSKQPSSKKGIGLSDVSPFLKKIKKLNEGNNLNKELSNLIRDMSKLRLDKYMKEIVVELQNFFTDHRIALSAAHSLHASHTLIDPILLSLSNRKKMKLIPYTVPVMGSPGGLPIVDIPPWSVRKHGPLSDILRGPPVTMRLTSEVHSRVPVADVLFSRVKMSVAWKKKSSSSSSSVSSSSPSIASSSQSSSMFGSPSSSKSASKSPSKSSGATSASVSKRLPILSLQEWIRSVGRYPLYSLQQWSTDEVMSSVIVSLTELICAFHRVFLASSGSRFAKSMATAMLDCFNPETNKFVHSGWVPPDWSQTKTVTLEHIPAEYIRCHLQRTGQIRAYTSDSIATIGAVSSLTGTLSGQSALDEISGSSAALSMLKDRNLWSVGDADDLASMDRSSSSTTQGFTPKSVFQVMLSKTSSDHVGSSSDITSGISSSIVTGAGISGSSSSSSSSITGMSDGGSSAMGYSSASSDARFVIFLKQKLHLRVLVYLWFCGMYESKESPSKNKVWQLLDLLLKLSKDSLNKRMSPWHRQFIEQVRRMRKLGSSVEDSRCYRPIDLLSEQFDIEQYSDDDKGETNFLKRDIKNARRLQLMMREWDDFQMHVLSLITDFLSYAGEEMCGFLSKLSARNMILSGYNGPELTMTDPLKKPWLRMFDDSESMDSASSAAAVSSSTSVSTQSTKKKKMSKKEHNAALEKKKRRMALAKKRKAAAAAAAAASKKRKKKGGGSDSNDDSNGDDSADESSSITDSDDDDFSLSDSNSDVDLSSLDDDSSAPLKKSRGMGKTTKKGSSLKEKSRVQGKQKKRGGSSSSLSSSTMMKNKKKQSKKRSTSVLSSDDDESDGGGGKKAGKGTPLYWFALSNGTNNNDLMMTEEQKRSKDDHYSGMEEDKENEEEADLIAEKRPSSTVIINKFKSETSEILSKCFSKESVKTTLKFIEKGGRYYQSINMTDRIAIRKLITVYYFKVSLHWQWLNREVRVQRKKNQSLLLKHGELSVIRQRVTEQLEIVHYTLLMYLRRMHFFMNCYPLPSELPLPQLIEYNTDQITIDGETRTIEEALKDSFFDDLESEHFYNQLPDLKEMVPKMLLKGDSDIKKSKMRLNLEDDSNMIMDEMPSHLRDLDDTFKDLIKQADKKRRKAGSLSSSSSMMTSSTAQSSGMIMNEDGSLSEMTMTTKEEKIRDIREMKKLFEVMSKVYSKRDADELAEAFCYLNSKQSRKDLVLYLVTAEDVNSVSCYCRMVAILSKAGINISDRLVIMIERDLYGRLKIETEDDDSGGVIAADGVAGAAAGSSAVVEKMKDGLVLSSDMQEKNVLFQRRRLNRNRVTEYLCELVKFGIWPLSSVFDILRRNLRTGSGNILYNNNHNNNSSKMKSKRQRTGIINIRALSNVCEILQKCGRYLYKNPLSHERLKRLLRDMKTLVMTHNDIIGINDVLFDQVMATINVCNPTSESARVITTRLSNTEKFIDFLLFEYLKKDRSELIDERIDTVCSSLMYLVNGDDDVDDDDGDGPGSPVGGHSDSTLRRIRSFLVKRLIQACDMELSRLSLLCQLIGRLNQRCSQSSSSSSLSILCNMETEVLDAICEEIRLGLEDLDFTQTQVRINCIGYLGEMYMAGLCDTSVILHTLNLMLNFDVSIQESQLSLREIKMKRKKQRSEMLLEHGVGLTEDEEERLNMEQIKQRRKEEHKLLQLYEKYGKLEDEETKPYLNPDVDWTHHFRVQCVCSLLRIVGHCLLFEFARVESGLFDHSDDEDEDDDRGSSLPDWYLRKKMDEKFEFEILLLQFERLVIVISPLTMELEWVVNDLFDFMFKRQRFQSLRHIESLMQQLYASHASVIQEMSEKGSSGQDAMVVSYEGVLMDEAVEAMRELEDSEESEEEFEDEEDSEGESEEEEEEHEEDESLSDSMDEEDSVEEEDDDEEEEEEEDPDEWDEYRKGDILVPNTKEDEDLMDDYEKLMKSGGVYSSSSDNESDTYPVRRGTAGAMKSARQMLLELDDESMFVSEDDSDQRGMMDELDTNNGDSSMEPTSSSTAAKSTSFRLVASSKSSVALSIPDDSKFIRQRKSELGRIKREEESAKHATLEQIQRVTEIHSDDSEEDDSWDEDDEYSAYYYGDRPSSYSSSSSRFRGPPPKSSRSHRRMKPHEFMGRKRRAKVMRKELDKSKKHGRVHKAGTQLDGSAFAD